VDGHRAPAPWRVRPVPPDPEPATTDDPWPALPDDHRAATTPGAAYGTDDIQRRSDHLQRGR